MVCSNKEMDPNDTDHNIPFQLPPLPKKLRNEHRDHQFLPSLPALPLKSSTHKKTNKIDFLTDISDNLLVECRKLNSDNQKLKSRLKLIGRENEDLSEKVSHQAIFCEKLEQEQAKLRDSNWSLQAKLQSALNEVSLAKNSNIKLSKTLKSKIDQSEVLNKELDVTKTENLNLAENISVLKNRIKSELSELKKVNTSLDEENESLIRKVNALKAQLEGKSSIPVGMSPSLVDQPVCMGQNSALESTPRLNSSSTNQTIEQLRVSLVKVEDEKNELGDLLTTNTILSEGRLASNRKDKVSSAMNSRGTKPAQWQKEVRNSSEESFINESTFDTLTEGDDLLTKTGLESAIVENISKFQGEVTSAADNNKTVTSKLQQVDEKQKLTNRISNSITSKESSLLQDPDVKLGHDNLLEFVQEKEEWRSELAALQKDTKCLHSEKLGALQLIRNLELKFSESGLDIMVLKPSIDLLKEEIENVQMSNLKSLAYKDTMINDLKKQLSQLEISSNKLIIDEKKIATKAKTLDLDNVELQVNITNFELRHQEITNELNATKDIVTALEQNLAGQIEKNGILNAAVSSLKAQKQDFQSSISVLQFEKDSLKKKLSSLQDSLGDSQKVISGYKDTVAKFNKRLIESNKEHSSKDDFVSNLTKQLEDAEKSNLSLQSDYNQLKEVIDMTSDKVADLENQLNICEIELDTRNSQLSRSEKEKDDLELKLNDMENWKNAHLNQSLEIKKKHEDVTYRNESLQAEMILLNNTLIESKALHEKEKLSLVSQLSTAEKVAVDLQDKMNSLSDQLKSSECRLSNLAVEKEILVSKLERQVPLYTQLENERSIDLTALSVELLSQEDRYSNLNYANIALADKSLSLKTDASLINSELEFFKKKVSELEIDRSNLQTDISDKPNVTHLENEKSSLEFSKAEVENHKNLIQSDNVKPVTLLFDPENIMPAYISSTKNLNAQNTEVEGQLKDVLEEDLEEGTWKEYCNQEADSSSKENSTLIPQKQVFKKELELLNEADILNGSITTEDEKHSDVVQKITVTQKDISNGLLAIPVECDNLTDGRGILAQSVDAEQENSTLLEEMPDSLGPLIDTLANEKDKLFSNSDTSNSEPTHSEVPHLGNGENELSADHLETVQTKGWIPRVNQINNLPEDDENYASINISQIEYDELLYELNLLKENQNSTEIKYLDKVNDNGCCIVELDELQKLKEIQNVNTPAFKELMDDNNLLAISKKAYIATTVFKHPDPDNVVILPITYYNKLARSHDAVKKTKNMEAIDLNLVTLNSRLPGYHPGPSCNVAPDPYSLIGRTLSPAITNNTELTVNTNISLTNRNMMPLITQTMIGEYLYKYHRKLGILSSISETRHERYFWIHPYSMTLYWCDTNPVLSNPSDNKVKALAITGVSSVDDNNPLPPGLYHKSIVVHSIERNIKITCASRQRHNIWLNSMKYLLAKSTENLEFDEDPEVSTMAIRLTAQDSAITRSGSFRHNLPRSKSVVHDRGLPGRSSRLLFTQK